MRPQPRVQMKKAHEQVTTVTPDSPGIPRAMVLTVSFVLPGDRLVDTVAGGVASACLTPASGCQDHTTSPSACTRSRQQCRLRPPHSASHVRYYPETLLVSYGTKYPYSCSYY